MKTLIPELIRLYEEKDYRKVVKFVTPPDRLDEQVLLLGSLEKVAEIFGMNPSGNTFKLEGLKLIQSKTPELSDEGKTATFKTPGTPYDNITFIRIGKLWYPKN